MVNKWTLSGWVRWIRLGGKIKITDTWRSRDSKYNRKSREYQEKLSWRTKHNMRVISVVLTLDSSRDTRRVQRTRSEAAGHVTLWVCVCVLFLAAAHLQSAGSFIDWTIAPDGTSDPDGGLTRLLFHRAAVIGTSPQGPAGWTAPLISLPRYLHLSWKEEQHQLH